MFALFDSPFRYLSSWKIAGIDGQTAQVSTTLRSDAGTDCIYEDGRSTQSDVVASGVVVGIEHSCSTGGWRF